MLLRLLAPLALAYTAWAAPYPTVLKPTPKIRPLVLWHGLGDSAQGKGVLEFLDMIKEVHPGIFVHAVYIMDTEDADRKASYFGNLETQLEVVHEQLNNITELKDGFDAMGFSQGGQFLRAYLQLYNSPPMHNLITFGSQHMGISELSACGRFDLLCNLFRRYARGRIYSDWAQENLVPAQYFRDTARLPTYYTRNRWLPFINNEIPSNRNATYAKHLASLSNLVLAVFSNDTTVIPKESGWFGSYAPVSGELATETPPIVPMREQPLYTEDWIGLKTLDERGGVVEVTCEGPHMHLADACWKPLVEKYAGGVVDVVSKGATGLVVQGSQDRK